MHSDPMAQAPKVVISRADERTNRSLPIASPDVAEAIRQFQEQHYATWADESLPALAGKTPRQSIRTKVGRQQVDLLLREMENQEQRLPEPERFDFPRFAPLWGCRGGGR
jgi:hypothetical protein